MRKKRQHNSVLAFHDVDATAWAVCSSLRDYALSTRFDTTVAIEATINGIGFTSAPDTGVQELAVDYIRIAHNWVCIILNSLVMV